MTTYTAEAPKWTIAQKLAFRFVMLFFILYVLLESNGVIPFYEGIYNLFNEAVMQKIILWAAKHILHITRPIPLVPTGSGDTTYDYLTMLFITAASFAGMLVWSAFDWKRSNYNKLFYWLTVIVRYYVAITMIVYGGVKIVKLQFPAPSPGRLLQPLGYFSPMGLEWNYMGFSTGMNYITGIAEATCGLLLLFRRTTTLGAILGLVVAGNIMAVNYCFDVPVKLLSTMLVIMCLFLLAKDAKRLINFFLLNKEALPANHQPHRFKARWKNITLTTVKYLLVAYIILTNAYNDMAAGAFNGDDSPKTPLYGIYNVQSFVRNHDTIAPLTTDTTRWGKLIVNNYTNNAQVKLMNDSMKYYFIKADTLKHTIMMHLYIDTVHKYQFTYTRAKPDLLLLKGKWKTDSLHIVLKKFDMKKFRLFNRGFHWINETPYNR